MPNFLPSKPKKKQRPRIFLCTPSWSWGQAYSSLNSTKLSCSSGVTLIFLDISRLFFEYVNSLFYLENARKIKLLNLIYHSTFQCKQLNTVMTIGFTYTKEKKINHFRNITVPVGCSCVMKQSTRIEGFLQHFIEK